MLVLERVKLEGDGVQGTDGLADIEKDQYLLDKNFIDFGKSFYGVLQVVMQEIGCLYELVRVPWLKYGGETIVHVCTPTYKENMERCPATTSNSPILCCRLDNFM